MADNMLNNSTSHQGIHDITNGTLKNLKLDQQCETVFYNQNTEVCVDYV